MKKQKLSIAIPSSLVSEFKHLRDKTNIIGRIGRSASIFRVEEIIIYSYKKDETKLIKLILDYMDTPQYLRRHVYQKRPELRYIGTLPPLRTPHHSTKNLLSEVKVGDFREGIVKEKRGILSYLDIGLKKNLLLEGISPSKNSRLTVKITEKHPKLKGKVYSKANIPIYWGYNVHVFKSSLKNLLLEKHFDLKIGTSRLGLPINYMLDKIQKSISESQSIVIILGSSKNSILDIIDITDNDVTVYFDYLINTIPNQGTATIRTEEALHATLAILNLLR